MKKRKLKYLKKSASYDIQLKNLRKHGIIISDETKAKEFLSNVGYYRFGFYIYPFEESFPALNSQRKHFVIPGTTFEDIVNFYLFNSELRNIINKYLSIIEVAIRTTVVNEISQKYNNPYWFVDDSIVSLDFKNDFYEKAYKAIKKHEPIKRHHAKYQGRYAPAWKTIEYMTLGNLESLYNSLLKDKDKNLISYHFGEPAYATFSTYLSALREVRNACAHGNILIGLRLTHGIRKGSVSSTFPNNSNQKLSGALMVINFMLCQISTNLSTQFNEELRNSIKRVCEKSPKLDFYIFKETGINI